MWRATAKGLERRLTKVSFNTGVVPQHVCYDSASGCFFDGPYV